ncbi:putative JAB1 Mov34 MPN PAD 1 ubiquitin protease Maintenance of mitochondrial structure and function [Trypanosoma vivax]|uniref:26S proteasome regulatory subunit n=1 Tax=Trypanosoma vivax (strain Y486) TaxID=1055687 RepID=G0U4J3_TRYVY|nr:26S proteasome regulatory subunit [Trypanosoma vivax]KAH8611217.1 putative JAB1 Mov34 MPN PAD 1 ubiquitin protease Maintenance of mitochondrial structure and function [Trypanosoma vivax]CCC52357.1 26S proteasome regulatory subunit [Trypanosoma vivax Y486]
MANDNPGKSPKLNAVDSNGVGADLPDDAGAGNPPNSAEGQRGSQTLSRTAARVEVHPLVLLSLVDHYARVNAKAARKRRVAGLLLGRYTSLKDGTQVLDINNSFAVPFDEDPRNTDVWFLDTNYAEEMFSMFRRVHPRVQVVGWYSAGPSCTVQSNDILPHLLIADRFTPNPVYCIVNTDPNNKGVPVLAYTTVQGREGSRSLEFRNIPTHLGAQEAEEVGIEHLLRDLTDSTITTLSTQIQERELSLNHLAHVLQSIEEYLNDVSEGVMPISEDVLSVLQEVISLQPRIYHLKTSMDMIRHTNDQAVAMFIAAIGRCVGTLYGVIANRRRIAREVQAVRCRREQARREKLENEQHKAKEAEVVEDTGKENPGRGVNEG